MSEQSQFQVSDADFQRVRQIVYEHCGITLSDDKRALVQARVAREVRTSGAASTKEYLAHVLDGNEGKKFIEFIDAISTNLTSFFREDAHFTYLKKVELPRLLAAKRAAGDGRILIWSAACSSGEEPYSLTMTILEAIRQMPRGPAPWDLRVLATDISTKMLVTARAAVYPEKSLATVPGDYRQRYFVPTGDGELFQVSTDVRNAVRFRHLNLMDTWPFKGPFDFVFCRNVMIYFDKKTQQRLVERFWNVISPDGFLFTGHSESLTGIVHRFVNRRPAVYQRLAA
jgi:chemotaxis protein methyltransferase CheR